MALIIEKLKVALDKTSNVFDLQSEEGDKWHEARVYVRTCLNLLPETKDCFGFPSAIKLSEEEYNDLAQAYKDLKLLYVWYKSDYNSIETEAFCQKKGETLKTLCRVLKDVAFKEVKSYN